MPERHRRDADDGVHVVVDPDPLAEHVRIGCELRLPQSVTDDGDLLEAHAIVVGIDGPAQLGRNAEGLKEFAGDARTADANGSAADQLFFEAKFAVVERAQRAQKTHSLQAHLGADAVTGKNRYLERHRIKFLTTATNGF